MQYHVRRLLQAVITVFSVITFSFVIIRFMPGGPMDYLRSQMLQNNPGASEERINTLVETYQRVNPDQPVHVQYADYMTDLAVGDMGVSTWYKEPVSDIVIAAVPWTLFIMILSLVITFTIAILLGSVMGYREGSRFDAIGSTISIVLNSVPYYVAGLFLLFFLSYQQNIFPIGGRVGDGVPAGFTPEFVGSVLYHAALPVASFVITTFGILAILMRGNCIQVLGEDYLRVAELRGLSERTIAIKYVGRNAVLPMYTEFMISIGFLFGGAVVLEQIFSYWGLGYYFFKSIEARDYPLMMGCFIVITVAVVIGILLADLTYGWVDPRASRGETE